MIVSLGANKKRILAVLVLIAIAVCAFFLIPRGEKRQTFPGMTGEERLAFLTSFGWEAEAEPQDVREVVIPAKFNDVYAAYNTMQQAQGFDLLPYAGEKCTQYRYRITNYPNTPDGVFATLLVFEGNIIGGDVASGAEDGFMHGFAADSARYEMPKSVIKESASPAPNTGESTQNPTESETT